MEPFAVEIKSLIMILGGFALGILLVVTYFKYDNSSLFKGFGDIFINLSAQKRDKRDLLVFALIPLSVGMFALIFRIMLM